MRHLTGYMIRAAAGPTVFVTMVLTGIIWILQALRFVDEIINYDMTTGAFVYISFLLLPQLLPVTLPIGLFCGMLYAYWRMSNDSELVVMRAAGLSRMALARSGMILAGICAVFVASMTFYFMPLSNSTMRDTRFAWRYIYSTVVLREGEFTPLKKRLTVYVAERQPGGELHGLLIHDERQPGKSVTMMAEQGTLIRAEEGPKILLLNGNRQERDQATGTVNVLYFDRYNVEMDLIGENAPVRVAKIEERTIDELFLIDPGDFDAETYQRIRAEAHKRLALPLLTIALAMVAIATVLYGEFDRRGAGRRIWVGSVVAGMLQAAVLALTQAAATQASLIIVLYVLLFGAIGMSLFLLRAGSGLSTPGPTPVAA